jgi:hypothetical protein
VGRFCRNLWATWGKLCRIVCSGKRSGGAQSAGSGYFSFRSLGSTGMAYRGTPGLAWAWSYLVALVSRFIAWRKAFREFIFRVRFPLPVVAVVADVSIKNLVDERFPTFILQADTTIGVAWASRVRLLWCSLVQRRPVVELFQCSGGSVFEGGSQEFDGLLTTRGPDTAKLRVLRALSKFGNFPSTTARLAFCAGGCSRDTLKNGDPMTLGHFSMEDVERDWPRDAIYLSKDPQMLSSLGTQIVVARVSSEILRLLALSEHRPRPPLIQVVDNTRDVLGGRFFFGLGDNLLGAILVFEEANRTLRYPSIDWSNFSAADSLRPEKEIALTQLRYRGLQTIFQINGDLPVDFTWATRVYTNRRPVEGWGPEKSDFLFRNGVVPSERVEKALDGWLKSEGLTNRPFQTVHVRFGDRQDWKSTKFLAVKDALAKIAESGVTSVVIADHPEELGTLEFAASFHVRKSRSHHTGKDIRREDFDEVLEDFFLVGRSFRLLQVSRYYWGSGFSAVAADLLGVPRELFFRA